MQRLPIPTEADPMGLPSLCSYGKLPVSGDFVHRGMARPLLLQLDLWIQDGILAMQRVYGAQWLSHYLVAPVWFFAIPAGIWGEQRLVGVIVPSVDRVGRYFPFALIHPLPPGERLADCLPPASPWFTAAGNTLIQALHQGLSVDQVMERMVKVPLLGEAKGDIASVLGQDAGEGGGRFSWPELPTLFDARTDRSFWWAVPAPDRPPRQLIDRGLPADDLFCDLFGPPD